MGTGTSRRQVDAVPTYCYHSGNYHPQHYFDKIFLYKTTTYRKNDTHHWHTGKPFYINLYF